MERTTEQKRTMLLNMARGGEQAVYVFAVGWLIVVADKARVDAIGSRAEAVATMPCEHGALRSIYDATIGDIDTEEWDGSGVQYFATLHHFDDTDTDSDITAAMEAMPCLVNYGGTLRAVNTAAGGSEFAIVLKDMQAPQP